MSNEVYDDYEQAEIVKKWIRENGLAIGMGIAMGLSGLFGWQYWQDYQYQQKIGAAQGYTRIIAELQEGGEASTDALDNFNTAHSGSAYAGLVALQLAGKAVANLNLEEAASLLKVRFKNRFGLTTEAVGAIGEESAHVAGAIVEVADDERAFWAAIGRSGV